MARDDSPAFASLVALTFSADRQGCAFHLQAGDDCLSWMMHVFDGIRPQRRVNGMHRCATIMGVIRRTFSSSREGELKDWFEVGLPLLKTYGDPFTNTGGRR